MSRRGAAPTLVSDLQAQVRALADDLRQRSDQADDAWAVSLRAEYDEAFARGRTGLTWSEWRDGEVDLAAVAWVLASVFVRFCEDNGLIDGAWITGPGARFAQALDNETAFYQAEPSRNARDWLRAGFTELANLPAGRDLLDPRHNLVWRAPISADAAAGLLSFWRRQADNGSLVHDLTDPAWDTRFLGDLYQDLSDHAKKKYALLQTPVFVEEFILDRTLDPAITEFGLSTVRLIDPTCGSGHFLLGAFDRLLARWRVEAPGLDARELVQKALDAVHGVDINPFAVAIARFRLTVAALRASGVTRLRDAPAFALHVAVGDSLIKNGVQQELFADEAPAFAYASEDLAEHPGILERGRYHVVVGNPPYITVKDKALNELYRRDYDTCHRQYALSVPFMELFFELAVRGDSGPAGFVGQITSNSFMKREFGSKVIEQLLSGNGTLTITNPVDLIYVIDTSGAFIPGHGTPTVILIGRRRRPVGATVRAVLGVRGEPGQPVDPANGLVWSEIRDQVDGGGFDGTYVTVTDLPREVLAKHPWSLSGGGAGDLVSLLEGKASGTLSDRSESVGGAIRAGADEAYMRPRRLARERNIQDHVRPFVLGEGVRDYSWKGSDLIIFPYGPDLRADQEVVDVLWPWRTTLAQRATFQGVMADAGLHWTEYMQMTRAPYATPLSLVFAEVATHNHVVLDRGGKVFKQTAPVIKLPADASEAEHLDLLGVLNSSTACFWLKQVSHNKGNGGIGGGIGDEDWEPRYQFNATKWNDFPLPPNLPRDRATLLDSFAQESAKHLPSAVVPGGVSRARLDQGRAAWQAMRERMVFVQEELDWEVYRSYGLIDDDFTYAGGAIDAIALGERAFEIALARRVLDGDEETSWFDRHGSTPITDLPAEWPADYRALVQRRLDVIVSDPFIGLLERPEYKRRWNSPTFDDLLPDALRALVLDRLEDPSLWSDASGPVVRSVAQLADRVRGDADLVAAVTLLRGAVEVDLTKELTALIADEAVPYLAALRYKESGLRKRAEWERVWDLQRREDAGEQVSIPVPPKYTSADFRKPAYWKARGKLDVPKERFIAYPGVQRLGDASPVIGWAGWDHLDQARALARFLMEAGETLTAEQSEQLVRGLIELEPWLHQWHADPDPAFGGVSPAAYMSTFIDAQAARLAIPR